MSVRNAFRTLGVLYSGSSFLRVSQKNWGFISQLVCPLYQHFSFGQPPYLCKIWHIIMLGTNVREKLPELPVHESTRSDVIHYVSFTPCKTLSIFRVIAARFCWWTIQWSGVISWPFFSSSSSLVKPFCTQFIAGAPSVSMAVGFARSSFFLFDCTHDSSVNIAPCCGAFHTTNEIDYLIDTA